MRVFLGISGASGAPYAKRPAGVLAAGGCEGGPCVAGAGVELLAAGLHHDAPASAGEPVARRRTSPRERR